MIAGQRSVLWPECQHRLESIRRGIVGVVLLRIGVSNINFKEDPKQIFKGFVLFGISVKTRPELNLLCSGATSKMDRSFRAGI